MPQSMPNFEQSVQNSSSPKGIGSYRWMICSLLFFATTVNYLDRQVLSLLKPSLEEIFGWTNTDYADIAAAFQFAYAIGLLVAGRIVDKLDTKKGYAWAIIIWSVGAIIHAQAYRRECMLHWMDRACCGSVLGFFFCQKRFSNR